jgi:DNA-binding PadR family transcriptional regulator
MLTRCVQKYYVKRKYYPLCEEGASELERLKEQWLVVHDALERLTESTEAGE